MAHWTNKLTKAQIQHLLDAGTLDIESFRKSREAQREMALVHAGVHDKPLESCHECRAIAIRLGIETRG